MQVDRARGEVRRSDSVFVSDPRSENRTRLIRGIDWRSDGTITAAPGGAKVYQGRDDYHQGDDNQGGSRMFANGKTHPQSTLG